MLPLFITDTYWRTNLIVCALNVMLAIGLDFVLGYAGQLENTPLLDAGIVAVPAHDLNALGRELIRILSDDRLREELRARNVAVQREYFSWDAISKAYAEALSDGDTAGAARAAMPR